MLSTNRKRPWQGVIGDRCTNSLIAPGDSSAGRDRVLAIRLFAKPTASLAQERKYTIRWHTSSRRAGIRLSPSLIKTSERP
jgi:hypothetical protein